MLSQTIEKLKNSLQIVLDEAARKYSDVHADIRAALEPQGWRYSGDLKIPYMYKGDVRVWFKKQSVYVGIGSKMGTAHTLTYEDLRKIPIEKIVKLIYKSIEFEKKRAS